MRLQTRRDEMSIPEIDAAPPEQQAKFAGAIKQHG